MSLQELHHKLGHVSEENMITRITPTGPRTLTDCHACAVGKQRRHPLVTNLEQQSAQKLELIHRDLIGPFQSKTATGEWYVMTILDDFSRHYWTFLLAEKPKTFPTF